MLLKNSPQHTNLSNRRVRKKMSTSSLLTVNKEMKLFQFCKILDKYKMRMAAIIIKEYEEVEGRIVLYGRLKVAAGSYCDRVRDQVFGCRTCRLESSLYRLSLLSRARPIVPDIIIQQLVSWLRYNPPGA